MRRAIIVFAISLAIILFSPIPYYQKPVVCKPGQVYCPPPGWYFKPSLFEYLYEIFVIKVNQSEAIIIKTPTPTLDLYPAPNGDLANWKTYSYTGLGFSFKLPPNWQVDPSQKADIKIIESDYGVEGPQFLIGPSETIKILDQKKDESKIGNIKEIVKGYIGYAGMLSKDSSKETQIDIDGKTAVKKTANEDFKFFEEVLIPLKGNYKLILMIEKLETQQIFDQILSTFKFLD